MVEIRTPQSITITQVTHDLPKKLSYVTLIWDTQADKRLVLPIPYATPLENLGAEARKAVQGFIDELTSASIRLPPR